DEQPVDTGLAFAGELRERRFKKIAQVAIGAGGGPGADLPPAGFERQKIVERIGDGGRRARSAAHHDAALGEPLALPAQFFAFPASDRAIEIADASVLGGEQCALLTRERRLFAAARRDGLIERLRERALPRQIR